MTYVAPIGDDSLEVPLLVPVGRPLEEALPWLDPAGAALDISGDSWEAAIFDPNTPLWSGIALTTTVVTSTVTITAAASALDTAIGDRQNLRWRLTNLTTGRDILAGPVIRNARGHGRRFTLSDIDAIQVVTTTVQVQIGEYVIGNIDGGTATSTFDEAISGGSA